MGFLIGLTIYSFACLLLYFVLTYISYKYRSWFVSKDPKESDFFAMPNLYLLAIIASFYFGNDTKRINAAPAFFISSLWPFVLFGFFILVFAEIISYLFNKLHTYYVSKLYKRFNKVK